MTQPNETSIKPAPLTISRRISAPRAIVFKAWSSAEHLKNWFSPEGFTVPEAVIDFRAGGVCDICMRSPDGQDFWSRGKYVEVSPLDRLVFITSAVVNDERKFTAHTTVTFAADCMGTLLTVRQEYEIYDEAFLAATEGAPEGWRTTLDKLEREVARIQVEGQISAVHGSFTLERIYDVPPAVVFHALTDQEAKAQWFEGGEGYTAIAREMDVRPGGREHLQGRWTSGTVSTFDAVYFDIVPNRRLVYAYEMRINDRKISVSLTSLELQPEGDGTMLTITEQGAFLDGYEDAGSRMHGTGLLLDRLGEALRDITM